LLVTFRALADHVTHGSGKAEASADLDATLRPIRRQLLEALADHPVSEHGEPVQRAPLIAGGLTADMAAIARKAESRRRRDVPAMAATRADLLRELRAIKATNTASKLAAMLWGYVEDLLADDGPDASGRLELVEIEGGERAFRLYGLSAIGKGWRDVPTLHLDATADMSLIRARVPGAEHFATIEASEPHVMVHQVVGRVFGKTALQHGSAGPDARRFVLATAAENGGRWLVIGSKAAADDWRETTPPNVAVAHWGDVRGLDSFNDVRGLVCVGRWGVAPNAVGRMAAILTGRAIPRVEGWYPTQATTLTAADGSARTVDADRHPDAMAEAVRAAVVEAELVQAIGRGRGVRRTAADPLTVYVLGNSPLPVPLASISDWQPVDCDRAMLADHGAVLASDDDAAVVVGKTRNAVKAARQRLESRPYRSFLYGHDSNLPDGLASADYQRAGAGRSESRMIYDPSRIPDPQAWLEAKFGPLVHFEGDRAPLSVRTDERPPAVTPVAAIVEKPCSRRCDRRPPSKSCPRPGFWGP
jgi:putative DNA primase/helicase